jgi:hypothetical protein
MALISGVARVRRRQIKSVFTQEQVRNAVWVIDYSGQIANATLMNEECVAASCPAAAAVAALWPGDDWVDWVFINMFESTKKKHYRIKADYSTMLNNSLQVLRNVNSSGHCHCVPGKDAHCHGCDLASKPWGLGAFASHGLPIGNKPAVDTADRVKFLEDASAGMKTHPELKAYLYFDSLDSQVNTNGSTEVAAAFERFLSSPELKLGDAGAPPRKSDDGYAPLFDLFGRPGGEEQKCSGAQIVRTSKALLAWGICGGGAGVINRTIWLRRSSDFGVTWQAAVPQPHLGAQDLSQFIYDPATTTILSMAPPPDMKNSDDGGRCLPSPSCANPFSCVSKSSDEGASWSHYVPAGCKGNYTGGGSGEGCGGITLSTGNIIAPFGFGGKGKAPTPGGVGNFVIISSDGSTWRAGNATPALPSRNGWGEAMVAELANGSVVLTSRLSTARSMGPIQRGFAISHTGGRTWAKSWSFPADQPYDVNFGPGYNVEHGLTSADKRTKLLLSKPTATLHGDSSGKRPQCGRHTQGSCTYRRNLTVAASADGGATVRARPGRISAVSVP